MKCYRWAHEDYGIKDHSGGLIWFKMSISVRYEKILSHYRQHLYSTKVMCACGDVCMCLDFKVRDNFKMYIS